MLAGTQHTPALLSEPEGAFALLAENPNRAVIFVHGFFGHPRKTWLNFQSLIDQMKDKFPWYERCDLYFYRYESRDQIRSLAEAFLPFVRKVVSPEGTSELLHEAAQPILLETGILLRSGFEPRREYQEIILVGHSTGALIIRDAVNMEIRPPDMALADFEKRTKNLSIPPYASEPLLQSKIRFFAPAHRGAIVAGRIQALLHLPYADKVFAFLLMSNPLYHNVKEGSTIIDDIKNDTRNYHDRFQSLNSLTAVCVFGSADEIVNIGNYEFEKRLVSLPGHVHTSICKPTKDFLSPLKFVSDGTA